MVPENTFKEQPGKEMKIGGKGTVVQLKEYIKKVKRDTTDKIVGVYPREHSRHHIASKQRENTNPHHIGTTPATHRPSPYQKPTTKARRPQPTHSPPTKRAHTIDARHSHPRQRLSGEHPAERGKVQQDISSRLVPKV